MNLSLISAWKEGVSLDIDFGKQILSCGYKRICFTSLNQVSFSKFLQKCETSGTGYRYWCSYTLNENVPAKGQHYIILHRTERQCNVGYITVNWPSFISIHFILLHFVCSTENKVLSNKTLFFELFSVKATVIFYTVFLFRCCLQEWMFSLFINWLCN